VVQNPRTGEILALANAPSFNPNLSREITPEKLKNHAVSDAYEPGSVFKTVTYSSAFEEKLARPEEVINCDPGYIVVGGIRIHDSHHIGTVTLERAYAESSDVGAVKMALRLGPDRFYKHECGTAGRDSRTIAQPDSLGCLLDRFHGDRAGGWGYGPASGLDDVVDRQRRHLFLAADCCRGYSAQ
jgi:membrane carboxypeptidase/penicillin-binding protein